MIVGTAGHIDHGKTTLIRALTGVDTDRLKEEKERGISIELGYAYVPLENGDVLGFIDAPGHERFVPTMVSGAGGIDHALLVVAADDGIMPQTREHLMILDLLGVTSGTLVFTKADRVDRSVLAEMETAVRTLIAPTALRDAPSFVVNATRADDAGVAALKAHLMAQASATPPRNAGGYFRLAIDRVFTLPGHGTIVAGTARGGRLSTGESTALLPEGLSVRARGLHVQNRPAASGQAGQRCAVNLAGVDLARVHRGDWLADARSMLPTRRVDVRLLWRGERPLTDRALLHLHVGTTHQPARVVLLQDGIDPGGSGLAQLGVEQSFCTAAGDAFIVRDAQGRHTVGGGMILDPEAPARQRRTPERLESLGAIERMLRGGGFARLLDAAPTGIEFGRLSRLCGLPADRLLPLLQGRAIETPRAKFAITEEHWEALRAAALATTQRFHDMEPHEPGIEAARLLRLAGLRLHESLWRAVLDALLDDGLLARNGAWLHLPSHRPDLSAEDAALATRFRELIDAGALNPPWVRDLAAETAVAEPRVRKILNQCAIRGDFAQVVPDLFFGQAALKQLLGALRELAGLHTTVRAADYRDALKLGRKRSIQILEYFDRVGYTRRVIAGRILRTDLD